jgi:hypothetical protein
MVDEQFLYNSDGQQAVPAHPVSLITNEIYIYIYIYRVFHDFRS